MLRPGHPPVKHTGAIVDADAKPLSLANVKHTEDGAKLKALLLTDDLTYQPPRR